MKRYKKKRQKYIIKIVPYAPRPYLKSVTSPYFSGRKWSAIKENAIVFPTAKSAQKCIDSLQGIALSEGKRIIIMKKEQA